jgi:hypothetical protein
MKTKTALTAGSWRENEPGRRLKAGRSLKARRKMRIGLKV